MKNILLTSIIIALLLNGCNEDKVTIPKVKTATRVGLASANHQANFSDVISEIKAKLLSTHELKYCKINVLKEGDNIILLGQVYTKKQKFLASSIARSVQGSSRVINNLDMP